MRFVAAIAGVLVSVPPLIFVWVGAQTFVRSLERGLAFAMMVATFALLGLSVALLFTPAVQRLQGMLLLATIATLTVALVVYRQSR